MGASSAVVVGCMYIDSVEKRDCGLPRVYHFTDKFVNTETPVLLLSTCVPHES